MTPPQCVEHELPSSPLLVAVGSQMFRHLADQGEATDSIKLGRAEAAGYMRSAVAISRSAFKAAAVSSGIVALSLGAYGATMSPSQEYTGNYPTELLLASNLYKFHLERILCFAEEKTWEDIDIVAFETLPRLSEIEAVRLVMSELEVKHGMSKRFWISCVFPDGNSLPDGSSISRVLQAMLFRYSLPHPVFEETAPARLR